MSASPERKHTVTICDIATLHLYYIHVSLTTGRLHTGVWKAELFWLAIKASPAIRTAPGFFLLMFKLRLHNNETDFLLRIYETSHSPGSVLPYLSFPSIPGSHSVGPTHAWDGARSHLFMHPLHSISCLRLIHKFEKRFSFQELLFFLLPQKKKKNLLIYYIKHGSVTCVMNFRVYWSKTWQVSNIVRCCERCL